MAEPKKPNFIGLAVVALVVAFLLRNKPDVDPTPPGPEPLPNFRAVVFIEESGNDRNPVLTSSELRKWLTANTTNQNGVPDWRIWDPNYTEAQLARVGAPYRALYEQGRNDSAGTLPWLVANGRKVISRKLPDTVQETISVLTPVLGE